MLSPPFVSLLLKNQTLGLPARAAPPAGPQARPTRAHPTASALLSLGFLA